MNFKNYAANHWRNYRNRSTVGRKIVVIESDDWGVNRMPSKISLENMRSQGIMVDKCPYNSYDTFATHGDLERLYNVLSQFSDHMGNQPKVTKNVIVANPDFDRIRNANYLEYMYTTVDICYKNTEMSDQNLKLFTTAEKNNLVSIQFHGREHVHVERWLSFLRNGDKETLIAFNNGVFGLSTNLVSKRRSSFLAALDCDVEQQVMSKIEAIQDGLSIFEDIFGKSARSFIAPNYSWSRSLEVVFQNSEVRSIQGCNFRNSSLDTSRRNAVFGLRNDYGQKYLIRNCHFEPTISGVDSCVNRTMAEIKAAFSWGNPAVISSHRLNYVSGLDRMNAESGLKNLNLLFKSILSKWPDVEFMTSDELEKVII